VKDHLGNVRLVFSDLKDVNIGNIGRTRYKLDVRAVNNYYPYGMEIEAGSWSGGDYNYGYNGMLKEAIGDDISHTHFRNLSVGDFVGWWSPDPLDIIFPSIYHY